MDVVQKIAKKKKKKKKDTNRDSYVTSGPVYTISYMYVLRLLGRNTVVLNSYLCMRYVHVLSFLYMCTDHTLLPSLESVY